MKTRIVYLLLTLCLLSADLRGTITQITTLDQFEQAVNQLGTNDLVMFDVDNVLIVPDDAILRPSGKRFLKKYLASIAERELCIDELWGSVMVSMTVSLVDERMPDLVREIQKRQIPVIAFTACWSGALGSIPSCTDWRIHELKKLGYDFSSSLSHVGFWQLPIPNQSNHLPTFKSGVLFSPHRPKGETLKDFLAAISWTPRTLVFIDDREDYLQSVEAAAQALGIEFHGYQYMAVFNMPNTFDERIGEIQMRHLLEHSEWLSDSVLLNNLECSTLK